MPLHAVEIEDDANRGIGVSANANLPDDIGGEAENRVGERRGGLDAADARPRGRVLDGRSVFALLRDRGREWGRDMLIEGGAGAAGVFTAIRTYSYVYVEYANGERELYDLLRDAAQLMSRHADPAYASAVSRKLPPASR